MEARAVFPLRIEETMFSYNNYTAFLARADGIAAFKAWQQAAFEAERERWRAEKIDEAPLDDAASALGSGGEVPDGCVGQFVEAPGNVWKVAVEDGDHVEIGRTLLVIEIDEDADIDPRDSARHSPRLAGETRPDLAHRRPGLRFGGSLTAAVPVRQKRHPAQARVIRLPPPPRACRRGTRNCAARAQEPFRTSPPACALTAATNSWSRVRCASLVR